jgi:hypothetical protein
MSRQEQLLFAILGSIIGILTCIAAWLVVPEFRAYLSSQVGNAAHEILTWWLRVRRGIGWALAVFGMIVCLASLFAMAEAGTGIPTRRIASEPPMTPTPSATSTPTPTPKPFSERALFLETENRLWIQDLNSHAKRPIPIPMNSGFSCATVSSAVWSRDGSRILIACSGRDAGGGERSVLRVVDYTLSVAYDIQAAPPPEMLNLSTYQDAIWSPDETQIVLGYKPDGANRCAVVMNSNGTGWKRINQCQIDDHPRFWSVNGNWIFVYNERRHAIVAHAVDENDTGSTPEPNAPFFDETYYPWRTTSKSQCNPYRPGFQPFWDCLSFQGD